MKSWASLCSYAAEVPLLGIQKLVQGKMDDERVRLTYELNLRVCDLSSIDDPSIAGYSFLKDQLGISVITLDRCWLGPDSTIFIWFLSLSDKLRALREKKKLFSLSPKIYVDEDLTRSQVAELKQARALIVAARQDGKYAVIRNLKVVIHETFPTGWVPRAASKAK